MAVEFTLDKFGVPVEGGRQGPMLMPKRKYLFRVRFLNFGNIGNQATPLTLNAQTVTLPQLSHDIGEVHGYNSRAYFAGKHQWEAVEMTLRDDVTNTVSRNVDAQMQRQVDHFNQTGYRAATDYKFTAIIDTMDGGNDAVLDSWTLEGCFIQNYNPGDMDYADTAGHRMITLSLRYDNAIHYDEADNRLMSTPSSDPQGRNI